MFQTKQFRGDYPERQEAANKWGADLYIENHYNAKMHERGGASDNYTMALVGSNASSRSREIADWYARRAHEVLKGHFPGLRNGGVHQPEFRGRGDFNLRMTKMPALLLEPLFISDMDQEAFAADDRGAEIVASILVDTVRHFLPQGGKVALSTGHLGKRTTPRDPGAIGPAGHTEAALADKVTQAAIRLLTQSAPPAKSTEPKDEDPTLDLLKKIVHEGRARDVKIVSSLDRLGERLGNLELAVSELGSTLTNHLHSDNRQHDAAGKRIKALEGLMESFSGKLEAVTASH